MILPKPFSRRFLLIPFWTGSKRSNTYGQARPYRQNMFWLESARNIPKDINLQIFRQMLQQSTRASSRVRGEDDQFMKFLAGSHRELCGRTQVNCSDSGPEFLVPCKAERSFLDFLRALLKPGSE